MHGAEVDGQDGLGGGLGERKLPEGGFPRRSTTPQGTTASNASFTLSRASCSRRATRYPFPTISRATRAQEEEGQVRIVQLAKGVRPDLVVLLFC